MTMPDMEDRDQGIVADNVRAMGPMSEEERRNFHAVAMGIAARRR